MSALNTHSMHAAADGLDQSTGDFAKTNFTIGFDGFVDEILHAVATRRDKSTFERIKTIPEFAARIAAAAGKSANIELVPQQVKPGGNGPLMSMAVSGMGGRVTCVGLLGHPLPLPVFEPLAARASLLSVGNPGRTDAIEFQDGKIMLGKLNTIADVNWARLEDVIGADRLRALLFDPAHVDLVACTNWTMLTEMDTILEQVIALVPTGSPVQFFFDLADPEKRDRADIARVLDQITRLNQKAGCILGLNLREAEQVIEVLNLGALPVETSESVEEAAVRIAKAMNLQGIVVHAVKCAGAAIRRAEGTYDSAGIDGPYCANPRLSTGAGDHFNGGFVSGLLSGLDVRGALYSGVGTSGWYVRNARSPQRADVIGFLRDWASGRLAD
jgi:sugar/nucleoside kinase (ribokinase family)